MAALPSEEDLEYLWRPKRTLRDWGETDYNIVRNWTPHNKKLAPPTSSSKLPKTSVTNFSKKLPDSFHQGEPSTSYRLRRSTRKQSSADHEVSWYVPNVPINNVNGLDTSSSSLRQNHGDRGGRFKSNEICESRQIHSDAHSSGMSSSESPNALLSQSHISDTSTSSRQLLSPNSKEVPVQVASQSIGEYETNCGGMSDGEEQSAPVQRPDNEDSVSEGGIDKGDTRMATEEEINGGEPMDCEDMDTGDQPLSSKNSTGTRASSSKTNNKKSTTGKGKKPANKPKRIKSARKMKLCPAAEDVAQTATDLTELEGCFTVYDHIVKEAGTELDNEAVQNALVSHWKGTQRQLLSMIKDLHSEAALEKRPTKGKTKQHQRQKEVLGVLKNLQRNNGEYHEALAKAKQEKQRLEALNVERQIAAVGLLLQSKSAR